MCVNESVRETKMQNERVKQDLRERHVERGARERRERERKRGEDR